MSRPLDDGAVGPPALTFQAEIMQSVDARNRCWTAAFDGVQRARVLR
jgi:hypothetical protein